MKPLVGHNPRDFTECDSVPEGRQDVATGESPWYAMMERRKSRRDDRNCDWVVSCRPFRTENHLYFSNHGLTPLATTCRHIRGSNAGSCISPLRPFRASTFDIAVSWGDAPGFHIVPRCGNPLRPHDPCVEKDVWNYTTKT